MSDIKTEISVLRPLQLIAEWLGILPPRKSRRCFKCVYPLVLIVVIILIYGYETYGKIVYTGEIFESTVQVIDLASDLSITLTNIIAILGINIINGAETLSFLNHWRVIDNEFRSVGKTKYGNVRFYAELIATHVLFLGYGIYDGFLWVNSIGFDVYKYYIFKQAQVYHIIILAMVLRQFALSIKYRLEVLNGILCGFSNNRDDGVIVILGRKTEEQQLRKFMKVYTKITVAMDKYNLVFGWSFVTFYVWIIVNLLMPIDIVLLYGGGEKKVSGASFGANLVMLCLMWAAVPVVIMTAIFSACQKATVEAERTTNICYNLIHELTNSENDLQCKKELRELAQQSRNESLSFSAAGLFSVNYNTIYCMVGSISSYLIVLIQFHK